MVLVQFTAIPLVLWDWYWESKEARVQEPKTKDLRKTRWQLQKELENPRARVTKETLERMRGYGASDDLLNFIDSIRQDKYL